MFEKLVLVVGAIALLMFISFLVSWPVYLLWNGCLVDAVSGVKSVTWLQAWRLTVMCSLLFKSTADSK